MKLIDMSDLDQDWIVRFQHKYYVPLALSLGIALPSLLAHFLWNDFMGGFFYAGYVTRILIWHVTFAINRFLFSILFLFN
jgi:stearoyl-CoA desaturase (Delta-9 desaturase)